MIAQNDNYKMITSVKRLAASLQGVFLLCNLCDKLIVYKHKLAVHNWDKEQTASIFKRGKQQLKEELKWQNQKRLRREAS